MKFEFLFQRKVVHYESDEDDVVEKATDLITYKILADQMDYTNDQNDRAEHEEDVENAEMDEEVRNLSNFTFDLALIDGFYLFWFSFVSNL